MGADENLVNQVIPSFDNFSIEPSLPPVQYPLQREKKKLSWKKIIIYFFGFIVLLIFLLIGGVFFSSRVLGVRPYIVFTPKVIPAGFERARTFQSAKDAEGRLSMFTYSNLVGQEFIYILQLHAIDNQKCSPPPSGVSFISDYADFRPKDSKVGCAMTLTKNDGNKKRIYFWRSESAKYYIFAENLSISDQQAMDLANSLKFELIFGEKSSVTSNINLDF